jgi:GAF domain-containing protein
VALVTISREHQVAETCVALTDSVLSDHDALDRLTMLVEGTVVLLDVTVAAAVVLLEDGPDVPDTSDEQVSAETTPPRFRRLEVFAVAIGHEPGEDGVHIGQSVTVEDAVPELLGGPPGLGAAAGSKFAGAHSLPMRWRDRTLGVLTLLHSAPGTVLPEVEVRLAQSLADAATIGLLHERAVRDPRTVAEHLRQAMDRVRIEQAEGILAQQGNLSPAEALSVLRHHSRIHKVPLSDVADGVVTGRLDLS